MIGVNHFKRLKLLNKKKNMLFKKKFTKKVLISKRISLLLKKRKSWDNNQKLVRRFDSGSFFFKKFFFKTLIRSRKILKTTISIKSRARQYNITKILGKCKPNSLSITNLLLFSQLFFFNHDVQKALSFGYIYLNGKQIKHTGLLVNIGDLIQIKLSKKIYKYIKICKTFFKKKVKLYRFLAWKFFKNKKKKTINKNKKRKNPNYMNFMYLFKFNTPTYMEVDYKSLSIALLQVPESISYNPFYQQKIITYRFFKLYNFKKIN